MPDPSEITSVNPSGPSNTAVEGDDLHPERITRLGDYISDKTRGDPTIESRNEYPVPYEREDYKTTTPDGHPTGPTNTSDLDGFINDLNAAEQEAVEYFKNLSKGFQGERTGGTFNQDEVPNKQTQTDGHKFLSEKAPGSISSVLRSNRFSQVKFNDAQNFINNPQDQYGLEASRMSTGKNVLTADEADALSKIGVSLSIAASGISPGVGDDGQAINVISVPQDNLRAKNVDLGNTIPVLPVKDQPKYNGNARIRMNNQARRFVSAVRGSQFAAAVLYLITIETAIKRMFEVMNLNKTPTLRRSASIYPEEAGYIPGNTFQKGRSRYSHRGVRQLDDLIDMGIPIPINALSQNDLSDLGPTQNVIAHALKVGFFQMSRAIMESETIEAGYFLTLQKLLVEEIKAITQGGVDTINPVKDFSMGGINPIDNVRNFFKNSRTFAFARTIINLGDIIIGANSLFDGEKPNSRALNKILLDSMPDSATTRHMKHRRFNGKNTLSVSNTPSMYLLPDSILRAGYTIGLQEKTELQNINMNQNNLEGNKFAVDYLNLVNDKNLYETALSQKLGSAGQNSTGNRFTKEQVFHLENILEAEHMPFYVQDLRTNEIISFHAFISSLSDSFSPSFTTSQGFGRIEPVQIYNNTTRSVAVTFSIYAYNKQDLDELYFKVNKLLTMIYPQWSRGTMIESGEDRFVMPFSQVPTATPLVRLRVGDLIKSNYSRQGIARLMGAGDPSFRDSATAGATVGAFADDIKNKVQANKDQRNKDGKSSDGHIQVGRTVMVHAQGRVVEVSDVATQLLKGSAYMNRSFKAEIISARNPDFVLVKPIDVTLPKRIAEATLLRVSRASIGAEILRPVFADPVITGSVTTTGLFSDKNPIIRSFETTMGRGLAGVISGLGVEWKMGTIPWELEPGYRGPTGVEISLTLSVIHDITPGLDSDGFNRAPIYGIGDTNAVIAGDPHGPKNIKETNSDRVSNDTSKSLEEDATSANSTLFSR